MQEIHNNASDRHPSGLNDILIWLARPLETDPADDLVSFGKHCDALGQLQLDPLRYHRILDLFYDRAHKLTTALREVLIEAKLPLERSLRAKAALLIELHGQVTTGYERVLQQADERLTKNKRRNPSIVAARALRSLSAQLDASCLVAAPPPSNLWLRAHHLARIASETFDPEIKVSPAIQLDADKLYKGMLALAAAQPRGLSPSEVALTCDYLTQFAVAVETQAQAPEKTEDGWEGWYVVNTEQDTGPVAPNRHELSQDKKQLFCSFQRLARLLGEQISALESGMPAANLRLSEHAASPAGICALKHLQTHWKTPPLRKSMRRAINYRAEVCIGLDDLWKLIDQGITPANTDGLVDLDNLETSPPQTTEWMVINESPSGFAVMHVSGKMEGLVQGSVIALRTTSEKPWNVCVVRWMKSDSADHLELGLEMLAPLAQSVRLMFRNGDQSQQPTPGLLLPAVPALRKNQALLTPPGSYSARRFFIVSGEDTTQVKQARLISLDVQTGSFELFQFEHEPFPLL